MKNEKKARLRALDAKELAATTGGAPEVCYAEGKAYSHGSTHANGQVCNNGSWI